MPTVTTLTLSSRRKATGFRIIANRRGIAGDGEYVANAANGPRAEQHGLQADDVVVARREVRNRFNASRFEGARDDQRVHAHARHGPAVDVNGVDLARSHNLVDLLEDAVERKPLGRIDFHADAEFLFLQFFPELAFGNALRDWRGL